MRISGSTKLTFIKIIHTIVWIFFNVVIFYLLYAALTGRLDRYVWISVGLILLEGLVLVVCKGFCPLTILARRYSNSTRDNFDIYLPNWLARYNKLIYISIIIVALGIWVYRLLKS